MDITLEDITEEPKQEEQPPQQAPQQPPVSFDSVQRKRLNKIFKCSACGKTMTKKTLLYAHNCLGKPTKAEKETMVPPPVVRVKEVIREVHKEPEITDQHIEDYINRKKQAQQDKAKQDRQARFNKLMSNAF